MELLDKQSNRMSSVFCVQSLIPVCSLRGFDVIHLASALLFTYSKEIDLFFACFDHTLNAAAIKEGLKVIHN